MKRPWNPAYQPVWDAMTPAERRRSGIFDVVLAMAVVLGLVLLAGCHRVSDTSTPQEGTTETAKTAPTPYSAFVDGRLVVDPETGCQYFEASHGELTPRYAWGGSGLYIVGCHEYQGEKR